MNDSFAIRKREDLAKLKTLRGRLPQDMLEITGVKGDPPRELSLRIRLPTAKNASYPRERQDVNDVTFQFPERYPFQEPAVMFTTPIWNPNVYASGKYCFGGWKVTENLELFVIRLMKVITLDPSIVNPRSAANAEAARWFLEAIQRYPKLFPTESLAEVISAAERPKMIWRNIK